MSLNFGQDQSQVQAPTQAATGVMNLAKAVQAGERINLSKSVGQFITKYAVGMEWNEKPGIVADCDISILLADAQGNPIRGLNKDANQLPDPNKPRCLCYYNQDKLPGVMSYGDNQTGNDDEIQTPTGNDEQIDVDFSMLEPDVEQILIICTTHSEQRDAATGKLNGIPGPPLPFGRVAIPILTIFDNSGAVPVAKYTFRLDEQQSTATSVEVAKFYVRDGDWIYVSMADMVGTEAFGLQGILNRYPTIGQ